MPNGTSSGLRATNRLFCPVSWNPQRLHDRRDSRSVLHHVAGKPQHPPTLQRRRVVLLRVGAHPGAARMPTLDPRAAFNLDGQLTEQPGAVEPPAARGVEPYLGRWHRQEPRMDLLIE